MGNTLLKPNSARQAAVVYGWAAAANHGLRDVTPTLVAFIAHWSCLPECEVQEEIALLATRGFNEVEKSWRH